MAPLSLGPRSRPLLVKSRGSPKSAWKWLSVCAEFRVSRRTRFCSFQALTFNSNATCNSQLMINSFYQENLSALFLSAFQRSDFSKHATRRKNSISYRERLRRYPLLLSRYPIRFSCGSRVLRSLSETSLASCLFKSNAHRSSRNSSEYSRRSKFLANSLLACQTRFYSNQAF